jgi:hypothetical protein
LAAGSNGSKSLCKGHWTKDEVSSLALYSC